jgi:hypothetical protein
LSCNILKDRASIVENTELFQILYTIGLVGLLGEHYHILCVHASWFLAVYLLPFFEIEPVQADLLIWYVTFDSLHNGKKIFKKKAYLSVDIRLTPPVTW